MISDHEWRIIQTTTVILLRPRASDNLWDLHASLLIFYFTLKTRLVSWYCMCERSEGKCTTDKKQFHKWYDSKRYSCASIGSACCMMRSSSSMLRTDLNTLRYSHLVFRIHFFISVLIFKSVRMKSTLTRANKWHFAVKINAAVKCAT